MQPRQLQLICQGIGKTWNLVSKQDETGDLKQNLDIIWHSWDKTISKFDIQKIICICQFREADLKLLLHIYSIHVHYFTWRKMNLGKFELFLITFITGTYVGSYWNVCHPSCGSPVYWSVLCIMIHHHWLCLHVVNRINILLLFLNE